ncbi:hypothetical protein ACFL09_00890 [Planctomycetota bacterium]
MAKEHPRRADRFMDLVVALDLYLRAPARLSRNELLKYLGDPDLATGGEDATRYVYVMEHPRMTGWGAYVDLSGEDVRSVHFGQLPVPDDPRFGPYHVPGRED